MSGPKVVRIVTREEVVAICEGLLARLDAALEEWVRVGRRNSVVTDEEIAAVRSRQKEIGKMLLESRFADVQREVPAELAGLQADMDRRRSAAAAAAAAARSAERRRAQVAKSVLAALDSAGIGVPVELSRRLHSAAAEGADASTAIAQGFELLAQVPSTSLTERQRDLAAALKDDGDDRGFDTSSKIEIYSPHEELLKKVDGYIATLRGLTDEATCAPFESRAALLATAPGDGSLAPKLDSLVVDVARAVEAARELSAARMRLRLAAAELDQIGLAAASQAAKEAIAVIEGPLELLKRHELKMAAVLQQIRNEAAAKARRHAVLEGLASLGYEVTEQMDTAWVANGRVVLRQSSRPDYGVEVGGGADADRVQIRTVAFRDAAGAVDAGKDRDAETIWCGEFGQLREQFAKGGGEIFVEQALGVGIAPLRVVGLTADDRETPIERSHGSKNARELT